MVSYSSTRRGTVNRLTGMAILTALIFALQSLSNFVSFGPVSITLALTPIIIGGAVYGPKAGAELGFSFGIIVLLSGLFGWDKGFVLMLWDINPVALLSCIFIKCTACGWISALVYKWLSNFGSSDREIFVKLDSIKKDNDGLMVSEDDRLEVRGISLGVIASAIICPLVNTGIFIVFMLTFFADVLRGWAGDSANLFVYAITAFIGLNFAVELAVNLILSTGMSRIIKTVT